MSLETEPWLEHSEEAFRAWKDTPRYKRRQLIEAWIHHYRIAMEELAFLITGETGKPISLARAEVQRGICTLQATLEAIASFGEQAVPYDLMPGAECCRATLRRFPLGSVLAITPFNFPVNLALHKLAPAIGCGCSALWKPCPQAPGTSHLLSRTFEQARKDTGAPEHLIQTVHVEPQQAEILAQDSRVAVVSFTGSERVGLHLKQILQDKILVLELGGNAAVVLDEGLHAVKVAKQLAPAAMAGGGQSCSKAQRFYIHRKIWSDFVPAFVEAVHTLPVGDPMDPSTVVGPLINEAQAIRMDNLVDQALSRGAEVLLRGKRQGRLLPPIILSGIDNLDPLSCEECFSPIAILNPVTTFREGLDQAAATRFGLRACAYSRDANHLRLASQRLRAGGVLLNLPPTFRLDSAPFGGLGCSGHGFEGPWWAMEHFTEARLIVEGPAL